MIEELDDLQKKAEAELAIAGTEAEFLAVRTRYLGRKGLLTGVLRNVGQVSPDERPLLGKRSNEIKELLAEKIEKALKEFGVPVEDVAAGGAEDAGQSGKIFALIRPLVEGLVREIRYSFTYFMTNLKEEKPAKLFITGFGTKFKNLDVFLGRELSLNVQTLLLPAKIQNRLVVDSEDPIETSQCVSGVAGLFAGGAAVNFLPFEFRCLKFESIQRKFLLLVAVALAGVLTMSFFFIRLQSSFVSHQISIQEHHLQALGIYGDLSGKAFPRHFLISEIERGTVPANGVLKLLAHLLPREIVINRFVLDAANKQVLLDVSVELPEGQRGAAVEGYALRLKKSSFFKKVSLQALPGVSGTSYRLEGIFHDD